MTIFELKSINRWYDLDHVAARVLMREDLERLGFFAIPDNEVMYDWFVIDKIPFDMLYKLILAIQFFDRSRLPSDQKQLN